MVDYLQSTTTVRSETARGRPDTGSDLGQDLRLLSIPRLTQLGFELAGLPGLHGTALRQRVRQAMDDVDGLIYDLRHFAVDRLEGDADWAGLGLAFGELTADGEARRECVTRLSVEGDVAALPAEVAGNLRAVVAETVHHAVAHSRTINLVVTVTVCGGEAEVSVTT